jgi:hypothetical protein
MGCQLVGGFGRGRGWRGETWGPRHRDGGMRETKEQRCVQDGWRAAPERERKDSRPLRPKVESDQGTRTVAGVLSAWGSVDGWTFTGKVDSPNLPKSSAVASSSSGVDGSRGVARTYSPVLASCRRCRVS